MTHAETDEFKLLYIQIMLQYPKVAMENSMDKYITDETGGIQQDDNDESTDVKQTVNYTKTSVCKQPSVYKLDSKIKFRHWLAAFKNFASAAKIRDEDLIDSMLTYFSPESLRRVEALGLNAEDRKNVELSMKKITKALSNSSVVSTAKIKLLKSRQKRNESITDFATKLMDLAIEAYPEKSKKDLRNEILMDVFLANLRSEYIALSVLRECPAEFRQALDSAIKLEAIIARRGYEETPSNSEDERKENTLVIDNKDDMLNVQCLRCGEIGHHGNECFSDTEDFQLQGDMNSQTGYGIQIDDETEIMDNYGNNEHCEQQYHEDNYGNYGHYDQQYDEDNWAFDDGKYNQTDQLQREMMQLEADYPIDY